VNKTILLLLLCVVVAQAQTEFKTAMPKDFAATSRAFKTFYEDKLKQHGIVGSSCMFLHDGQIVDKHFYGLANREKNQAVTEDTIYHWASITKTFTGIAIMQLRDRGLLKLEDSIVKYVPELKAVHNPFGSMEAITIKQLLSHSAGFRDGTWPWGGDKDWHPHEPAAWSQLVAMLPYTAILFPPGSRFSYSNPGIVYLGRVIETLAGEDYEVYLDKNIFKPLEMHRSYFDATPYHLLKHRSHSYTLRDGELKPARFDVDTGITVSNGGLNAPLTDLAKYLSFLMGDAKRQDVYDGVLKRSSLEAMWQPQLPIADDAMLTPTGRERKNSIGLTYFIEDNFGQHFIGHSGGQNGFISHFYLRPDNRTAYLVAFNTHAIPSEKNKAQDTRLLDHEIKEWLFERVFPLFTKP
jgi:CubicO group peptidase (beta-lactamase class C family)